TCSFKLLLGCCFPVRRLMFVRREALLAAGALAGGPFRKDSELRGWLRKFGRLTLADALAGGQP
ncbi:MAG TPA: hypothetical protein VFC07_01580, partial [Verrucomicrobiae bacterium]|nr:hypothetical protein [Verrucomicrobiae bacterium]